MHALMNDMLMQKRDRVCYHPRRSNKTHGSSYHKGCTKALGKVKNITQIQRVGEREIHHEYVKYESFSGDRYAWILEQVDMFLFYSKRPHGKNVQLFPDKEPHYFYKTTHIILALEGQLLSISDQYQYDSYHIYRNS